MSSLASSLREEGLSSDTDLGSEVAPCNRLFSDRCSLLQSPEDFEFSC